MSNDGGGNNISSGGVDDDDHGKPNAAVAHLLDETDSRQLPADLNDDILSENYWLREKLKEIQLDRDRLVCEVANLRLELDMGELKRLPEERLDLNAMKDNLKFLAETQRMLLESFQTQQQHHMTNGNANNPHYHHHQHNSNEPPNEHGPKFDDDDLSSRVYDAPAQPPATINNYYPPPQSFVAPPPPPPPPLPALPFGEDNRSFNIPQKINDRQSPAYVVQGNAGGYVYLQQQHYTPPQHVVYQQHSQQPHSACHPQQHPGQPVQTLHKKGSVRNGNEVLKRTRLQNAYELSQDLIDKQIELLERKYGGIVARNAAITIQRAFRHYTMVQKFASITAMAKAEKRLSRRIPHQREQQPDYVDDGASTYSDHEPNSQHQHQQPQQQQQQQRVCATITATPPGSRITPVRSMSLRERRSLDASPIPRSQSGNSSPMPVTCWSTPPPTSATTITHTGSAASGGGGGGGAAATTNTSQHSHPHVNLLHAEQHYYSTPQPQHYQQQQYQPPATHQLQYCQPDIGHMSASSQMMLDCSASSSTHSMNSSWNSSPHQPAQPYYSAAQIYMRPRTAAQIAASKRPPPEVPKRTSSITGQRLPHERALRPNGLCKTAENGSLSSVQSSGSDSSADRVLCGGSGGAGGDACSDRSTSPQWKQRGKGNCSLLSAQSPDHGGCVSTAGGTSDVECSINSHTSAAHYSSDQNVEPISLNNNNTNGNGNSTFRVSETIRKRQYRVGLNLFNKKPEKGITYLIRRGFLENAPLGVARFLISRKGLSRQMIGEYLGNLQNSFNMAVLESFVGELDLSGMQVDVALRKFQQCFRMPGEAQKIERLMEVFSQRYCQCNSDIVARLRSSDTIFVMAFAIIMLNTDLHTPNLKPERRMRVEDFIKNLRGIDDCHDIERDLLAGIYERVKTNEFKVGSDHVTQVMKVQATMVGKKPNLALPHRRLVCYCRLYEIPDINKKERVGVHQREVFLFNDLLVITKIFNKKKTSVTYAFRNSFPLCGMVVTLQDVPNYSYCIRLSQKVDDKVLVSFNARNEHDRCKFAEDLREAISEMDEMDTLRIEAELEKQKSARGQRNGNAENRDSGVADVEVCTYQSSPSGEPGGPMHHQHHHHHHHHHQSHSEAQLKRSALSNSLLDMHEQFGTEKPQRRGSVGSLDSGMSISFQSTTASSGSRNDSKTRLAMQQQQQQQQQIHQHHQQHIHHQQHPQHHIHQSHPGQYPHAVGASPISHHQHQHHMSGSPASSVQHPGFLGGIFQKRERKLSKSDDVVVVVAAAGGAGAVVTGVSSGGVGSPSAGGAFGRSTEV